jgi:hypothetical protein
MSRVCSQKRPPALPGCTYVVEAGSVVVMSTHGGVMSCNSRILITPSTAFSPTQTSSLAKLSLHHSRTTFSSTLCYCEKMTDQVSEHIASKYRYELLFGAWLLVTGGTFLRISKQPYSSRLKIEQYESIFKGTSLSAVLLGIGMTPTRSTARRFRAN